MMHAVSRIQFVGADMLIESIQSSSAALFNLSGKVYMVCLKYNLLLLSVCLSNFLKFVFMFGRDILPLHEVFLTSFIVSFVP